MYQDLAKEIPRIWKQIRKILIGGKGKNAGKPTPKGNARPGSIVRMAEKRYGASKGSYWYREFRPDDPMISGGSAQQYYATLTSTTIEEILATGNQITVPTREMIASFGYLCRADLGKKGWVRWKKHNVVKDLVMARPIYRAVNPDNYMFRMNKIITGVENEKLNFQIYNGLPSDLSKAVVLPVMFRIAPRDVLNLTKPIER